MSRIKVSHIGHAQNPLHKQVGAAGRQALLW